jgi:hypothetical protein
MDRDRFRTSAQLQSQFANALLNKAPRQAIDSNAEQAGDGYVLTVCEIEEAQSVMPLLGWYWVVRCFGPYCKIIMRVIITQIGRPIRQYLFTAYCGSDSLPLKRRIG